MRTNAYYGQGSGLVMITGVGCTGEEPNLLNCTHSGYGRTYCGHSKDAGVRCPGSQSAIYRPFFVFTHTIYSKAVTLL